MSQEMIATEVPNGIIKKALIESGKWAVLIGLVVFLLSGGV